MAEPHRKLIAAIRRALRAEADPARAAGAQAYMKSEMPFLGVPVPRVRAIAHAQCKEYPLESLGAYVETVRALFMRAKFREERYAALGVAGAPVHRRMQTAAALPLYRTLIIEGAWWDLVDELACRVGEVLATSREFFLRKAIGWALRSVAWHDPDWTVAYVRDHAGALSSLSQREALKNLPGA